MATSGDARLSNELDHLVVAAEPRTVTSVPEFQETVRVVRERSHAAKTNLDTAVAAAEADATENAAVAVAFDAAKGAAIKELIYVGGNIKPRLLNLRDERKAELGPVEMSNRELFVANAFDETPSRIAEMGRTAAKNKLVDIYQSLAARPEYVPPEELVLLRARMDAVVAAHAALVAESLDDSLVLEALNVARAEGTLCRVAFRELLDAFLRLEGGSLTVDEFVLRAQRRAAAAPTPTTTPTEAEEGD